MRRFRKRFNSSRQKGTEKRRLCPYCRKLSPSSSYNLHVSQKCACRPKDDVQISTPLPQWVKIACLECKTEIYIHVDWENPSFLCRSCYTKTCVKKQCERCKADVFINVHWIDPLILCKRCREQRRITMNKRQSRKNRRRQMRPSKRMGPIGKSVMPKTSMCQGGLPSLGKRR